MGHRPADAPRMTRRYLDQRLRLSLLRVVDAVETQGSLLKASAALGISQPALTKNLQELEDILQIRLFDRYLVPWLARLEAIAPPPFGQSLFAVLRKP